MHQAGQKNRTTFLQGRRRWLIHGLLMLAAATGILIAGAMLWNAVATARVAVAYPPRGQFVDVGGARMHVICRGAGEPTLVMQGGIAGGALDWLPIMEELASTHRVCAFDRLGQDWSDPAPAPRTFPTAVREWHAALEALEIHEPVVVGHSLGGAVAQLYAAEYPVRGVILVDGLTAAAADEVTQRLANYRTLDGLARLGLLRPMGGLFADRAYDVALRREMSALRARSRALLSVTAEGALAAESLPADLRIAESQMEAPLLIIAAGQSEIPEAALFLEGLRALAGQRANAELVEVPDAAHYVIASHPQFVGETIERWLSQ
ncbi:MAG: alpha/beta fold hydrolase, partial [Anaerolineae bacterium]